jgi:hypothetical protein
MLNKYLQLNGIVTGPLERNTSYSGLEVLRKNLLGQPQFLGGEQFLFFGNALHEVFLQNKFDTYNQLPEHDKKLVDLMVEKLRKHPVVKQLMLNAKCEDKQYNFLEGVQLSYILDIEQVDKKRGADLKSTSCTTRQSCIDKAIEYGYAKQRSIYKRINKPPLKEFYFIFISKKPPHEIFIIGDSDFKKEEGYAEEELKFLLYFYKHYGRFVTEEDKLNLQTMKTGKEAMAELKTAYEEHQSNVKTTEKTRAKILKMIKSFPKNDAPLFAEKINKIQGKL